MFYDAVWYATGLVFALVLGINGAVYEVREKGAGSACFVGAYALIIAVFVGNLLTR